MIALNITRKCQRGLLLGILLRNPWMFCISASEISQLITLVKYVANGCTLKTKYSLLAVGFSGISAINHCVISIILLEQIKVKYRKILEIKDSNSFLMRLNGARVRQIKEAIAYKMLLPLSPNMKQNRQNVTLTHNR